MDAMKLINNLCEGYNAAADEPAMQELKPLPCPLCGSKEPKVNRGCGVVTCCEISVEDVAAWNALPRALTWTHEPPEVAGWYWRKEAVADRAHVFHFTGNWEDYGEHWESDHTWRHSVHQPDDRAGIYSPSAHDAQSV